MRAGVAAAVFILAWLSACVAVSPSATPSGSAVPVPESACPGINLRTPSGAPLNLTGRWRDIGSTIGATYYIRQSASCVWLTGFSPDTGAPGGEGTTEFTNASFGHLAPDFTFNAVWADLPWGRSDLSGTVTWKVGIDDVDGVDALTLSLIGGTTSRVLTLVEPDDTDVTLTVRLQQTERCVMVVGDDGEDYELIVAAPGWAVGAPTALVGPGGVNVLPGDPFEASGEVALGTWQCGPGRIFIADGMEAASNP